MKDWKFGINRIRLEFKGIFVDKCTVGHTRINRIRLEFKVISGVSVSTSGIWY